MRLKISFLLFFIYVFYGCSHRQNKFEFYGRTMGTTYKCVVVHNKIDEKFKQTIIDSVEATLKVINSQMSTYDSNSVISRINYAKANQAIFLPKEIREAIYLSRKVSMMSDGAFDITVMPLVNAWGFGPKKKNENKNIPTQEEIKEYLKYVGTDKYFLIDSFYIAKLYDEVNFDLAAVAKGYGVDAVAKTLDNLDIQSYLVEIGGEIYAKGYNEKGEKWKIGVDKPELNNFESDKIQKVIQISNCAVATSGNYRNYYFYQDKFYSHTIDPKTGKPVEHNLASVTIIAPTCAYADALATAVLVLGVEKGLKLVENIPDVECYLIEKLADGKYKEYCSSGFSQYEKK